MNRDLAPLRRDFLAAVVLGVAFGLQCLRALFPSLVYVLKDRMGVSSIGLAVIAIGLFALAGFAPPWIQKRSSIRAAAMLAGFLAGLRALLQLWPGDPLGFLILAAVGAVVFLALLAAIPSPDAARVFLCGASVDLALHALRNTQDLHWESGASDAAIVVLAAAALAFAYRANRSAAEFDLSSAPCSPGLFVWGPFLFLHLELFANVARLSARAGSSSEISGAILAASHAVALAILATGSSRNWKWMLAASAAAPLAILNSTVPGSVAFFQMPLAIVACAILLERSLLRTASSPIRGGAFGFGSVLLILLTFAHYADYDLQFPWARLHVWMAAGVLLVLSALRRDAHIESWSPSPVLAAIPLVLAGVLAISGFRRVGEPTHADQPLSESSRIVTFNLHAGFDEMGAFRFRSMMEKLVAEDADVVALQEVSRGWLINGSADLYELARSKIPYPGVFAATVDDDWGNAVFSKAKIQRVEEFPLPPADLALSRAVLAVELGAEHPPNSLRVLATHFHHRTPDDSIRLLQSQAVAAKFETQQPGVLLGDFNATPETPPMQLLRNKGWYEAPMLKGSFTYPSRAPDRRIDTILVCGQVEILDARVASDWGSDHRAVIVDLAVHPGLRAPS